MQITAKTEAAEKLINESRERQVEKTNRQQKSRQNREKYLNAIGRINRSNIPYMELCYKGKKLEQIKVEDDKATKDRGKLTFSPFIDDDNEVKMLYIGHYYEELTVEEFIERFEFNSR